MHTWNDPNLAYGNGRMGGMRPDANASLDAHINYGAGYQQHLNDKAESERQSRSYWSGGGGGSAGGGGGAAEGLGALIVAIPIAIAAGIGWLIWKFIEWYWNASRTWQLTMAALLMGAWTFASIQFGYPLEKQYSGETLTWCATTLWLWLALGILAVPLFRVFPRATSALVSLACLATMTTWDTVFQRHVLPS